MKREFSVALIGAIMFCGGKPLFAEEQIDVHPYLNQEFFVDVGMYFPTREVMFRVDGSVAGPGDNIDFEEQLGLRKSDETFALNFGWRFGEKWQVEGQYFDSSGRRDWVLEEDVEWNDIIFNQGTSVGIGQDFSLLRVFFARRFESSENHEFGIGAGLHWLELSAFIEGNVIIGGGGNEFRRESVTAEFPLPNIGAWYIYSFSSKWALKTRLDWLSADVGDYDGTLINASIGLNYQMFQHFGVGLNYNFFDLDVGVDRPNWRGEVELKYEGPFAYMSFYW